MINKNKPKLFIIFGAVIVALVFIVWQIVWFTSWHDSDLIFQGIKINGINISGYSVDNANIMLNDELQKSLEKKEINIVYTDIKVPLIVSNFVKYDCVSSVKRAHNLGRTDSNIKDYFTMLHTKLFGKQITVEPKIDIAVLQNELNTIAPLFYVEPQDAQIVSFDPNKPKGEKLTVLDEVIGQKLDIKKTANSIKTVLISGQKESNAYIYEAVPHITKDMLYSIDSKPVTSNQTFRNPTVEKQNTILQIVGAGRHQIIYPGEELSIIEFLGNEDYIYFEMPDADTGSENDYDVILCEQLPTQIYSASLMAEVDVVKRQHGKINKPHILSGTATIINKYYDMILKNNLDFPVIVRIGYNEYTNKLYCEVYRPPMENATLLRSVIHEEGTNTLVDIKRVYINKNGNPINSVLIETIVKDS